MRWHQLFADLEAQLEEVAAAGERAELGSRARIEIGAVRLGERLRGAIGVAVVLRCGPAARVEGTLVDAGADWVLVEDDRGQELLVALTAVRSVAGLGRAVAPPESAARDRVRPDLRRAVRALARERARLSVLLDDGTALTGTVDRVGADFLELAEHPLEEPRRASVVQGVQTVPLAALAVLRQVHTELA